MMIVTYNTFRVGLKLFFWIIFKFSLFFIISEKVSAFFISVIETLIFYIIEITQKTPIMKLNFWCDTIWINDIADIKFWTMNVY